MEYHEKTINRDVAFTRLDSKSRCFLFTSFLISSIVGALSLDEFFAFGNPRDIFFQFKETSFIFKPELPMAATTIIIWIVGGAIVVITVIIFMRIIIAGAATVMVMTFVLLKLMQQHESLLYFKLYFA